jgi:hypothetical protein
MSAGTSCIAGYTAAVGVTSLVWATGSTETPPTNYVKVVSLWTYVMTRDIYGRPVCAAYQHRQHVETCRKDVRTIWHFLEF